MVWVCRQHCCFLVASFVLLLLLQLNLMVLVLLTFVLWLLLSIKAPFVVLGSIDARVANGLDVC